MWKLNFLIRESTTEGKIYSRELVVEIASSGTKRGCPAGTAATGTPCPCRSQGRTDTRKTAHKPPPEPPSRAEQATTPPPPPLVKSLPPPLPPAPLYPSPPATPAIYRTPPAALKPLALPLDHTILPHACLLLPAAVSMAEALGELCRGGGWSYAAIWRSDRRDPR